MNPQPQPVHTLAPFVPLFGESLGVQLASFLAAFFPNPYEPIHLRAFAPKDAPAGFAYPEKLVVTREGLEVNESHVQTLIEWNKTRGIYFVVNAGGDTDAEITRYTAFFVECDDKPKAEQHQRFDAAPIRPDIRVETKQSVHGYFIAEPGCTETEWRAVQAGLIAYFGGDVKIKNPSRCMRLPYFNHVTRNADGSLSYVPVELVEFALVEPHSAAAMMAAYPAPVAPPKPEYQPTRRPDPAAPFGTWEQLNDELKQRIMAHPTARRNSAGNYDCRGICHDGKGDTGVFYNPSSGAVKCNKKCSHATLLLAFGLPAFSYSQPGVFFGSQQSTQPPAQQPDEPDTDHAAADPTDELGCTDMGNGYRFARQHGKGARFCASASKWFLFDGRRWAMDETGAAFRCAKQTVKSIYAAAAHTPDETRRKALARWATVSEGDSRMRAMLHQAESELPVNLEVFDADQMLFNCATGTLDLRTGTLRQHDRRDLLTKISEIAYDETAQAPRWLAFLEQIFDGDRDLISFLQKAAGYALTGETTEQCFFLCHGTGANGKTVLLKTLEAVPKPVDNRCWFCSLPSLWLGEQ